MNTRVIVMSRFDFEHNLRDQEIYDDNVEERTDLAFISIQLTKKVAPCEKPYFSKNHSNVLTLSFNDVTDQDSDLDGLFNRDQALAIIDFVEQNKGRIFLVHCHAGISRSGAVGTFIRQVLRLDYDSFMRDNPKIIPNQFILNLLNKTYSEGL